MNENNNKGFTLIELMVSMAMVSIVVGVIYSAYDVQTKIYSEQDKTAEMQQNIRAGIAYLQQEIRMAGYNPKGEEHGTCSKTGGGAAIEPGIHTATATSIGFSMDLNEDGDCDEPGENVTYSVYTSGGVSKLGRNDNNNAMAQQPVAENITHVNFYYLFTPPPMGSPATKPPTSTPVTGDLRKIAAIQVSLLARAKTSDSKSTADDVTFTVPIPDTWGQPTANPPVWQSFPDFPENSYRRRLLTTTINCRNTGLK